MVSAAAAAAARRRGKILEGSAQRMARVDGALQELSIEETAATNTTDTIADAPASVVDATVSTGDTPAIPSAKPAPAASSPDLDSLLDDTLDAVFDSPAAPAPTSPADPGDPESEPAEQPKKKLNGAARLKANRAARFKKNTPTKDKPTKTTEENATQEVEITAEMTPATAEVTPVAADEATDEVADPSSSSSPSKQFKFKGVAATRRKKSQMNNAMSPTLSAEAAAATPQRVRKKPSSVESYVELLVTLFLLFAGYSLGVTSVSNSYLSSVRPMSFANIKGENTDHLGIRLSSRFEGVDGDSYEMDEDRERDIKAKMGFSTERDFEPPAGANIDPVFKVDLDALTDDDTILSTLGRIAIWFHRLIIKLASLPLTVVMNFLPRTVPLFLALGLAIRGGAFVLFRATGVKSSLESNANGDLVAMAMNFVKNMFPQAFFLFDMYKVVMGDLLMVFFGTLVALATYDVVGGTHFGALMYWAGGDEMGLVLTQDKGEAEL